MPGPTGICIRIRQGSVSRNRDPDLRRPVHSDLDPRWPGKMDTDLKSTVSDPQNEQEMLENQKLN